jgi:hypothetical protein
VILPRQLRIGPQFPGMSCTRGSLSSCSSSLMIDYTLYWYKTTGYRKCKYAWLNMSCQSPCWNPSHGTFAELVPSQGDWFIPSKMMGSNISVENSWNASMSSELSGIVPAGPKSPDHAASAPAVPSSG